MSTYTGYLVLKNNFGKSVSDPKVTITANGFSRTPINEVSLQNGETTPSTQYFFPSDTPDTWAVSFTPDGGDLTTGSVVCDVTEKDEGKTTTVTLSEKDFTVTPPVTPAATGKYKS